MDAGKNETERGGESSVITCGMSKRDLLRGANIYVSLCLFMGYVFVFVGCSATGRVTGKTCSVMEAKGAEDLIFRFTGYDYPGDSGSHIMVQAFLVVGALLSLGLVGLMVFMCSALEAMVRNEIEERRRAELEYKW